jgi:hypothetical protein
MADDGVQVYDLAVIRLSGNERTHWAETEGLVDNHVWSLLIASDNTVWDCVGVQ